MTVWWLAINAGAGVLTYV